MFRGNIASPVARLHDSRKRKAPPRTKQNGRRPLVISDSCSSRSGHEFAPRYHNLPLQRGVDYLPARKPTVILVSCRAPTKRRDLVLKLLTSHQIHTEGSIKLLTSSVEDLPVPNLVWEDALVDKRGFSLRKCSTIAGSINCSGDFQR
ncbi:hypothetical protein TNCV_95191 [Trichonephila clavipes]|nr:hypothetical protein TNCV_95191 [Trichonephila clavipes]